MKKLLIALMGLILSMSLGLSGAYAQSKDYTTKDKSMSKEHSMARESGKFVTRAKADDFKANDIIGAKVEDTQQKKLGTIKDLAVDPRTDKIDFVVIGRGMGEKDVAVPFKSLALRKDDKGKIDFFVLNMTDDQLAKAPAFDKDSWPGMSNASSSRYYGQGSTWSGKEKKSSGSKESTSSSSTSKEKTY